MNLLFLISLLFLPFCSMALEINQEGFCQIGDEKYPAVGYGTYPHRGETCENALEHAIEHGYRIIDTATFYRNFEPIGKVIKEKDRKQFYIISKVWPDAQEPELLKEDLLKTLEDLQTDHIDAYLLHWPNHKVPIEKTLEAMEELRSKKLIRHIGLSNINVNHLIRALEVGIPITWVQVEMHPHFYDPVLIDFCHQNGILVQAWAPLGRGRLSEDPYLAQLGKKYQKTAAQVSLRWILQHGCLPLPGSKNESHIKENMAIFDFCLTSEEMDEIDSFARIGKRERVTGGSLGFTDEFDFTYDQCWPRTNR